MFMRLAIPAGRTQMLLALHPHELLSLVEQAWTTRQTAAAAAIGSPDNRSDVAGMAFAMPNVVPAAVPPAAVPPAAAGLPPPAAAHAALAGRAPPMAWDHLIYAYMIESTRVYEIFRRVLQELLHGEKLGVATLPASQQWLRSTEELFYSNPMPLSAMNVASDIRSDLRATRRNAYQRMFGMELSHGKDDNSPYPYQRADASNGEFATTFEELLRETWVGYTNIGTTSGPRPTDDAKISELATKLQNMLLTRRQGGTLSREEFFSVAVMSWFDLTLSVNAGIVIDLRVQAASAEERLFKIAQMVNLPAHGLSRSYFQIAQPLSEVLLEIEAGTFNGVGFVANFYDPALNTLVNQMLPIITHWSTITGRDLKARRVTTV